MTQDTGHRTQLDRAKNSRAYNPKQLRAVQRKIAHNPNNRNLTRARD